MDFEKYWEDFGELHASMCNGDIKQFAKEIWVSAQSELEQENAKLKAQLSNTRLGLEKMERLLMDTPDISICPINADGVPYFAIVCREGYIVSAETLADLIDRVALMEVEQDDHA